jgi:hypothetical protein
MKKTIFLFIFILPLLPLMAQRKKRERKPTDLWWTMYGQTQLMPGDVHITAKQPVIGYGSGHTVLLIRRDKEIKRVWMGFDFNQHYFGRKRVNDFRVFYETWQLSYVTRFSFTGTENLTPFIDLSGGLRLMVSFTANSRTYGGLLFRRFIDLVDATDGYDSDITDHKIIREHDRFMPTAGIGGGFWLKGKKSERGLSIKASVNFGTASKFADYRNIISESDTYNYTINRGSGRFYNFQIGYSFRD